MRSSTASVGAALIGAAAPDLLRKAARGPDDRPVGFALAGVGSLTERQVIPALQETKYARLAGLITGSPDRVRDVAAANGVPPSKIFTYDEMARLVEHDDIHVVYVVTPNALHRDHAIAAARAGKHVLCEKPMAISAAECEDMIAVCGEARVKLAVAYRLQFEAHHRECIRLARERVFGPVKVIEASFGFRLGDPNQWRLDRALAGGGALVDAGIYALQAARYVSGEEPAEVSGFQVQTDPSRFAEVEESLTWQMRFPSGALASCTTSYNARDMNRLRVHAEQGWFGLEPAYGYGGFVGRRMDGAPLEFPHVNHFAAEMDDFARCVLDDRESAVSGVEGLRDLRVIEAIYRATRLGRTVAVE